MSDMSESHDHHHHADHLSGKLGWTFLITVVYMSAEAIGGYYFNSLALLSDAGHMLSDAMAIGLSWVAVKIGRRRPTDKHTFGFRRYEILAALLNGLTLWIIVGFIFYEAQKRFFNPEPVIATGMVVIAAVGLLVNIVMAMLLFGSRHAGLNIKSAFLHIMGDALGSLGAVVAGIAIIFTGAYWLDPLVSVFVGVLILFSSWEIVKDSVNILMEGVPGNLDVNEIECTILSQPGVCCVSDLHVWSITGETHALSVHVVVGDPATDRDDLIDSINKILAAQFGLLHTTIQVDTGHRLNGNCGNEFCRPGTACNYPNGNSGHH